MKRVKLIAAACAMAIAAVLTNVAAQDFNTSNRTFLTFSGPVELPGATLQPGTYLFRLADSPSNRHIIQVLSQDETQIHATIMAVPAERLEVSGENVVTFREIAEGGTPAVHYWYYPGDRIGHEFVYPKDQALRIAQRSGERVLTSDDVSDAESTVSSIGPDGEMSEWTREGAPAQTAEREAGTVEGTTGVAEMPAQPAEPQSQETVDPASETPDPATETPPAEPVTAQPETAAPAEQPEPAAPVTQPEAAAPAQEPEPAAPAPAPEPQDERTVGTAGQVDDPAMQQERRELPRTASPLPLTGLIGLFSLAGAMALRRARK